MESGQDEDINPGYKTLTCKLENKPSGTKVQRMQDLLRKGKANLSRSKSELGEHNRKILQQINRGRSGLSEQNKKLLANIKLKEHGTQSFKN